MYYTDADKMHEECGVIGIYGSCGDDSIPLSLYWGLFALQHRGQESAGMALSDGKNMEVFRGMGLVGDVFSKLPEMNSNIGIGHVRYSTTGSSMPCNTQPFMVRYVGGSISMAHNGNLTNATEIRSRLEKGGSVFQTTVDSEVVANLIARSKCNTIEEQVLESVTQIQGAYCLVIMTRDKLIGVRDPHGFRPLCLGKNGSTWVLASESCALDAVGADFVRDIEPGEMVIIDEKGVKSKLFAYAEERAACVFEYIYFARPDSVIDGQSVYQARLAMGRELARESGIKADLVIAVPDSGREAALGYSYESGIPFAEGLIKNRYIGRTFIQPEQKNRDMGVRIKLNAVRSVVKDKSIVLIDDSIVRGTTSGKIVKMLKEAGAREIHMCISSPPINYPCYYGIDTSVRKELIAATHSIEEIRQYIGAESLHYLSIEGLCKALPLMQKEKMCLACFNSDYPVETPNQAGDEGEKYVFEG